MLTHLDPQGHANMVDVTAKAVTFREAQAEALVRMRPETLQLIVQGGHPKGDVFAVARIAGIQAAKKTSDLIPLCHPLLLTGVKVELTALGEDAVRIVAVNVTSADFQKGDRVRVRERSKSHAYGWGQCWNKHGHADKMEVGVIGTIEEIQCHDNYGVMLDNGCYFPEWTLEHAPAEEAAAVAPAATNLARNRDPDREVQTFKVGDTVRVVCKPNYAPSWNATRMGWK